MQHNWDFDAGATGDSPLGHAPLGRVVPADGDPEVERYQASLRAQEQRRAHALRLRSRHPLRNWAITLGVVALIVLFIKPLAVVAAVVAGTILVLLLIGLLAAGALLLALRADLGGRAAYYMGRGGAYRRTGHWHR